MNIYIVDAFTNQPFKGNPAAVCVLDRWPNEEWMQNVASEMNLSETAFVLSNVDQYELRWFTPEAEVDLCGHATLAAAHILWEEKLTNEDEIKFITKSGLLTAKQCADGIELNFPQEIADEVTAPDQLINGLGTPFLKVSKNRLDYLIEVESESDVQNLQPNFKAWKTLDARGVIVTSQSNQDGIDFVSRCFYPALGVNEDPVTGSAHCALGPYWQQKLGKSEFVAKQLSKRGGLLSLRLDEDRILIMGQAVTTMKGKLV